MYVGPLVCNTVRNSSKTGTVLLRNSNITLVTLRSPVASSAAARLKLMLFSFLVLSDKLAIHIKSFTKTVMYDMHNTASKINKSFKFWMLVFDGLLDLSHDCLMEGFHVTS